MSSEKLVVKILVRVFDDGTVDFGTNPSFEKLSRPERLVASAGLDAAKHAIQEDALRRALEEA